MTDCCIVPTGALSTRYGEAPAYEEGLHDLGNGVYAWMVPNGSWGEANAGLIAGDDASLLVDTLWDPGKTRQMLDAMAGVTADAPVTTLVNSHADGDHFWGNQLLPRADSITSERALAEMAQHRPRTMLALELYGRLLSLLPDGKRRQAGDYFRAMCAPYDFASVEHTPAKRAFSGSLDLDIGGRLVRLIEVGPAHTQGDLIVHVPDAGVIFAADILFIGSTPVMWAGPLENWLRALDLIMRLKAQTIVPGHGPLTGNDGVGQVKAYWEFVNAAARKHFDAGTPAARAAYAIAESSAFRGQPFAHWDSPERIMTNVYLLYREYAGRRGPVNILAKAALMRRQGVMAYAMGKASPAAMHRKLP